MDTTKLTVLKYRQPITRRPRGVSYVFIAMPLVNSGASGRIRTDIDAKANHALYPLSYAGVLFTKTKNAAMLMDLSISPRRTRKFTGFRNRLLILL